MNASPVAVGDVVANKYRVDGVLGRGGMGVVVSAIDIELDRSVAIKFVDRNDEQSSARFLREARAAANLDSQHVTRVFDSGRLEHGMPYLVMERLQGESFATLVRSGPIEAQRAASYMMQICDALAQAHARRLVHRDLKPDNLFLHTRSDGSRIVKVLDFGISKELDSSALTESRSIVGSPPYLSPEQIETPELVDPRTDVWALGVVFYELLSGERPFGGATMVELGMHILAREPAPLGARVPGLPDELEAIAMRCLCKAMDARFQNVAQLAQALQPFADAESSLLLSSIQRALAHEAEPSSRSTTKRRRPRRLDRARGDDRPRSRTPVLLAVAGTLLALGAIAFVALRSTRPEAVDTAAPPLSTAAVQASVAPKPPAPMPNPERAPGPGSGAAPARPQTPASRPPGPSAVAATDEPVAAQPKRPIEPPKARAAKQASTVAAQAAPARPALPPRAEPAADQAPPTAQAQSAEGPAEPSAAKPPGCRAVGVVENGHALDDTPSHRVTFEWARRLCTSHARAGAFELSESGMLVKCRCD